MYPDVPGCTRLFNTTPYAQKSAEKCRKVQKVAESGRKVQKRKPCTKNVMLPARQLHNNNNIVQHSSTYSTSTYCVLAHDNSTGPEGSFQPTYYYYYY
jgi:hypothetical protein